MGGGSCKAKFGAQKPQGKGKQRGAKKNQLKEKTPARKVKYKECLGLGKLTKEKKEKTGGRFRKGSEGPGEPKGKGNPETLTSPDFVASRIVPKSWDELDIREVG